MLIDSICVIEEAGLQNPSDRGSSTTQKTIGQNNGEIMSASQELLSIADSLSVLSRSQEPVAMGDEELAALAFALRDLSIRVGYLESRRAGFAVEQTVRRQPIPGTGADIIDFPARRQTLDKRATSAA